MDALICLCQRDARFARRMVAQWNDGTGGKDHGVARVYSRVTIEMFLLDRLDMGKAREVYREGSHQYTVPPVGRDRRA